MSIIAVQKACNMIYHAIAGAIERSRTIIHICIESRYVRRHVMSRTVWFFIWKMLTRIYWSFSLLNGQTEAFQKYTTSNIINYSNVIFWDFLDCTQLCDVICGNFVRFCIHDICWGVSCWYEEERGNLLQASDM